MLKQLVKMAIEVESMQDTAMKHVDRAVLFRLAKQIRLSAAHISHEDHNA